jgi:hypothetical protein
MGKVFVMLGVSPAGEAKVEETNELMEGSCERRATFTVLLFSFAEAT